MLERSRRLASSDAVDVWVAEGDGQIVGHVGLPRTTSDEVMALGLVGVAT